HGHAHIHVEGVVHGAREHHPPHDHPHSIPLLSVLTGISLHAFMEGLPLGFNFRFQATAPSLYLAVAAHKLPEAMLITSLVYHLKGKKAGLTALILFSLI